MIELDLKKTQRELYGAKPKPEFVEVPTRTFLMIDGHGDPDLPPYTAAVEALYSLAYPIRFALKNAGVVKYPVPPLEGLWWTDEFSDTPEHLRRDEWNWTMMIPQPSQVTGAVVAETLESVRREKGDRDEYRRLRLAEFTEGLSVQMLHVGPFSTEPETMTRMVRYSDEHGRKWTGRHHEIYLSDHRRTEPAKLRTILRHGVG